MFIIKHIYLENFMSIDNLDLEFNPNQITVIQGDNGSGKSTLMYAIALVFSDYKKDKYQSYVKIGRNNAKIIVDAELFGYPIKYDFEIIVDKKVTKTIKNIQYRNKTYLNDDCNIFIKEHNLDSLESIEFFFQDTNDITNARPVEISDMLKQVFELDSIKEASDELREKQEIERSNSIEYNARITEIENRNYNIVPLERTLNESGIKRLESNLEELEDKFRTIKNIDESQYNETIERINNTDSLIKRNELNSETIKKSISAINNELLSVQKSLDSFNDDTETSITSKIEELTDKINERKEERKRIADVYHDLKSILSVFNHEYSEVEDQIKISKTGVCHACGQPIGKDHVELLERKKEEILKNIKETSDKISSLGYSSNDEIGQNLEKERSNEKTRLFNLKSFKKDIININEELQSKNILLKEYEIRNTELTEQRKMLYDKFTELEKLKPQIEQKKELENKIEELKKNISKYKINIVKNEERKRLNEKISIEKEEDNKKKSELSLSLNESERKLSVLKESIDILEKGFTNYVIISTCEKLSNNINEIVKKVFPYMLVRLQGDRKGVNFYYNVDETQDNWLPVSMASGAQKQVLALGYKIAIAKCYNSTSIFLDEIDSNCSIEAAKKIYKFILGLEDFEQIFLITHKPDIIEVAKEQENVTVYNVENGEYSLV